MGLGRWLACIGALTIAIACSSGQEPVEDDSDTFPGPPGSGGSQPNQTDICEQQCIPLHAAGEVDYRGLRTCLLCDACYDVCVAEGVALDCAPGSNACSGFAATCAECTASTCALDQQPDTAFLGVCAVAAGVCQANQACLTISNCVGKCIEAANPTR